MGRTYRDRIHRSDSRRKASPSAIVICSHHQFPNEKMQEIVQNQIQCSIRQASFAACRLNFRKGQFMAFYLESMHPHRSNEAVGSMRTPKFDVPGSGRALKGYNDDGPWHKIHGINISEWNIRVTRMPIVATFCLYQGNFGFAREKREDMLLLIQNLADLTQSFLHH